jgi:ankyrin repeat protein
MQPNKNHNKRRLIARSCSVFVEWAPTAAKRGIGRQQRALHAAAQTGDASLLRQLLQPLVAAAVAEMSIEGAYPGPAAALLGHAVNCRERRGRSALLIACRYGSWECAELL